MNIATPIELSVSQAHERACDDVNRWRGHCIDRFAKLERSAGHALEAMSGKAPHMFGDKLKKLAAALEPSGSNPHPKVAKAIYEAKDLFEQRNRMVHATGRILIDRKGEWVWQYRFQPSGKAETTGCVDEKVAKTFEEQLTRRTQSICSQLDAITAKLAPKDD